MALDPRRPDRLANRAVQTRGLFRCLAGICAALLLSFASPLYALSCAPHTVETVLHKVKTAPEGYAAAIGTLSYNPSLVPKTDWDKNKLAPEESRFPARFKGKLLSASGFTSPLERKITIEFYCFGGWCPYLEPNRPILAFLKQTSGGYSLMAAACGSDLFFDPTPKMLKTTQDCYLRGKCPPKPRF